MCGTFDSMVLGRPDRANTMIKTIQYLAEGDYLHESLLLLISKAAFPARVPKSHVVQHRAKRCRPGSCLLQVVHWHNWAHRMHYDSAYTKIGADSGVDQRMSSVDLWFLGCH